MKTKALISLFAIALALVACNKNETEPAFTPELKLDKTEKISAPADGGSVNLKVTANVSWTATSNDETVATVAPASKEITDKKSAETPVTVTISENETTEARTATLTFKAEGCKDIVVEIEQAAGEIPDVFEVLDNTGLQPAPSSFDVAFAGETVVVYVNSNINWTATSSAATWLTATPASFNAESRDPEPTAVSIKATVNTDAARSATITFSAAGQQDVVITINQAVAPTLAISVEDITYKSAYVWVTPSDETLTYYSALVDKKDYDELIGKGATDDLLPAVFAKANAEYYKKTIQEFLKIVLFSGEDYYDYTDLDPETEYVFLTQYMDGDGNPLSSAFKATFTTGEKPTTDPEYTKFIGTWKLNHDKYNYNQSTDKFVKAGTGSWTAVIEENLVNQTYYISFPNEDDDVSPIDEGYYDRFPMAFQKQEDMSLLSLPFYYYGDLGFFWGFKGIEGYCAMIIVGYYQNSEDELEGVIFTWDDDTTLVPVYPEDPYVMTTGVVTEEEEYLGYYSGYVCPTSMEKVASNSSSVRKASAKSVDKRLDIKPAKHTRNACKPNMVKGLSYKKTPSRANYVELPR